MDKASRTGTGTARWLRVLLVASLAVNLLVVGAAVGAWMRFGDRGHGGSGFVYFRELPDAARRELRGAFRQTEGPDRSTRAELDAAVRTAIRAEPFDADALAGLMQRQAEASHARRAAVTAIWVAHVADMTPAERMAYADRIEAAQTRRPHPGNRD